VNALAVAVFLLAAPEDTKTETKAKSDWSQPAALGGFGAAAIAAGFAAAIPFTSNSRGGISDVPLALGITAFALVALVRPIAFFGSQSAGRPQSTPSRVLRVTGTAAALLGLGAFIVSCVLQANHSTGATGMWAATAGLEALSMTGFSADAAY
jgi:hypothetical protein